MSPPTQRTWLSALSANRQPDANIPSLPSRTMRLTTSLQRGFISATGLSHRTRAAVTDLIGTMAPERYVALPPRSHEAAKAAMTIALARGPLEVVRLENFRKSGRIGGGKEIPREQGGDPWFDTVIDALLLQAPPSASRPACLVLSALNMPCNASTVVPRLSQTPKEAFALDRVYGCSYNASVGFGPDLIPNNTKPDVIEIDTDSPPVSILPAVSSIPVPPETNHKPEVPHIEPKPSSPLPLHIVPALPDELTSLPPLDAFDTHLDPAESFTSPTPNSNTTHRWHVPVSIVFDDAGTVSIDFDIVSVPDINMPDKPAKLDVEAAPLTLPHSHDPHSKNERFIDNKPPVQILSDVTAKDPAEESPSPDQQSASCSIRRDAPSSMLQVMLRNLETPDLPPQSRSAGPDVISIVLDEDEPVPAAPSSQPRKSKKRTSAASRGELRERQQRRARIRSSVMSTMQEEPEVRRQKPTRPARPILKTPVASQPSSSAPRSSRRKKTPIIPNLPDFLDSDDEIDGGPSQSDEDFKIEEAIEVLPARTPVQTLFPDTHRTARESETGAEVVPVRKESERKRKERDPPQRRPETNHVEVIPVPTTPQPTVISVRDDEDEEEVVMPVSDHAMQIPSWDNDILRVEKLLSIREDGSPSVSSLADDSGDDRLFEPIPILQRVLQPVKEGRLFLLDVDGYDEHTEAMKLYQKTRDEPGYMEDADSPGTQFMLESWQKYVAFRNGSNIAEPAPVVFEPKVDNVIEVDPDVKDTWKPSLLAGSAVAQVSSESGGSSDESSAGSYSTENDETYEEPHMAADPPKKGGGKSRAARARELQARVCGELLQAMSNEGKRRVLRWAEKDFSWFDAGSDVMEIEATKTLTSCDRCDEMEKRPGSSRHSCEESILLKLWKDMTWRKIRRMRHRKSPAE